jgi:hypothetical protein
LLASSALTIRPYRVDDEHDLVELFARAFGHPVTEEHWRWKLRSRPSSIENVWLAVAEDKPVFQYAGIPTPFWLGQTAVTGMVSVDTMTAPEFRRRGLLTQVAGRVYAAWREAGVAFVIGLPNEQWGSRARVLGWRPLFPLQWLVRPLRPEAILARRLRAPSLKRATFAGVLWNRFLQSRVRRDPQLQTESIASADEAFDQIWEACKSDWMFSTVRNREWVNWRFLSAPARTYEVTLARRAGRPTGYSAYRVTTTHDFVSASLAELFAARADGATRDGLLHELIERLLSARVEALFTLAVPGTGYFRWLRGAGFLPRQRFSVELVPLSPELPLDRMLDPEHWNLSGADFDVI